MSYRELLLQLLSDKVSGGCMCDDLEGSGIVGGKRRSNKKVQQGRKLAKYNKLRKNGYSKSEARAAVFGSVSSRKKRSIKGKGLIGGKYDDRSIGIDFLKQLENELTKADGSPELYKYNIDGECGSRSRYGKYTDLYDGEGCIPIEKAYKNYRRNLEHFYDAPIEGDYEEKRKYKTDNSRASQIKREIKQRMLMKRLGITNKQELLDILGDKTYSDEVLARLAQKTAPKKTKT